MVSCCYEENNKPSYGTAVSGPLNLSTCLQSGWTTKPRVPLCSSGELGEVTSCASAGRPEYREIPLARELGGAWREHVLKLVGIGQLIPRLLWLPVRRLCAPHCARGQGN